MHNTLESHKLFPYIAWMLVAGFAFFTFSLTIHVQNELTDIGGGVERLEQKLIEMEQKEKAAQVQE